MLALKLGNVLPLKHKKLVVEDETLQECAKWYSTMPSWMFRIFIKASDGKEEYVQKTFPKDLDGTEKENPVSFCKWVRRILNGVADKESEYEITIKNVWILSSDFQSISVFLTKTIREDKHRRILAEVRRMAPSKMVICKKIRGVPEKATLHHYIWMMDPNTGIYITFGLNGLPKEQSAWKCPIPQDNETNFEDKTNVWEACNPKILFIQFPDLSVCACAREDADCYGRTMLIEDCKDGTTHAVGTMVSKIIINRYELITMFEDVVKNLFWLAFVKDTVEKKTKKDLLRIINDDGAKRIQFRTIIATEVKGWTFNYIVHMIPPQFRDEKESFVKEYYSDKINCTRFAGLIASPNARSVKMFKQNPTGTPEKK
jgi:hypothetical protein